MDVSSDFVTIASQTGRLDLLSAALAVLALLIGFAAFPFWNIAQRRAARIATEAAEKELERAVERAEQAVILKIESLLPTLEVEYWQLAANRVDTADTSGFAAAQGGVRDDEPKKEIETWFFRDRCESRAQTATAG